MKAKSNLGRRYLKGTAGDAERHPHRRRPQLPTCPRLAEDSFVPDPGDATQRDNGPSSVQIGFLTADYL